MGAWGYRPYDNDEAQDWLGIVQHAIITQIEAALQRNSPHTLVAAAKLLVDLDSPPLNLSYNAHRRRLFVRLHDALGRLLTERLPTRKRRVKERPGHRQRVSTWAETWDQPELMRGTLDLLMHRLRGAETERKTLRTMPVRQGGDGPRRKAPRYTFWIKKGSNRIYRKEPKRKPKLGKTRKQAGVGPLR